MSARTEADVAAVLVMMERLDVTITDLTEGQQPRRVMPTFGEYIPVVEARMPAGRTRDHLATYWRKILAHEGWAAKRLTEPTVADFKALCETIRAARVIRRSDRGGHNVVRHVIDALRKIYRHAEEEELLAVEQNRAARVAKPAQTRSNRRALPEELLAEIVEVASATGRDPELDSLLLRLHAETACRRAGALNLRPRDLEPVQSVILLREKGDTRLWQPVSPTLMRALCRHGEQRGAAPGEQLLRGRNGRPIGRNHHFRLFERLGRHLPWVRVHGVSIHWVRHTSITWVERHYGPAVAGAFARHETSAGPTTNIYTTATIYEVATALAHLTGEPHPLAGNSSSAFSLDTFTPQSALAAAG